MTVSLEQYCRALLSTVGALVAVPFVPPVVSALLSAIAPDWATRAKLIYPPLGSGQPFGLIFTVVASLVSIYLTYEWCRRGSGPARGSALVYLSIAAALCFFLFLGMCVRFAKIVHIERIDTDVFVSIGYERTEFTSSNRELAQLTDMELLKGRTPDELDIQKLWTLRSLIIVRMLLCASYTGFLVCLVWIFSIGVYQHATTRAAAAG